LFYKIFIIVYCPAAPASLCLVCHGTIFSARISFHEGKERKENSVQGLRDQAVCSTNHGIKKILK
jgi:hypothetical protein